MKLEGEIKQHHFRNENHKLAVNIFYTYGWLVRSQSKFIDKYDITLQQYNVLRILRGQYPEAATINLVKERMLDKMSDASRLVERLRVKGWLERSTADNDRRCAKVIITIKGLELLSEIDKFNDEADNTFSTLNDDEIRQLNVLLDKMRG